MSNGLSERRSADAPVPLFFATYRFSLHFPVSITYFTPGIVMEVSAMFVARMTLRIPDGVAANIFACCAGCREAYSGNMMTWTHNRGPFRMVLRYKLPMKMNTYS